MEDTSYILCQHKTYMGENFCHKCGGIFIPNINQAIKPRRYNTKIEMPVYSTNKQMMNDYELTQKLIQKTATSNEYIYNRKEVIKQFRFLIERLKFHEETFHSALFMTDLIMTKNPELPYEHVAIGCLSLAVKFIEIDTTIPDLSYLQIIFRSKKYSIRQIKNFELRFIRLLNYNVNYVTPYKFLRLLLTEGIVFPTDFQQDKEDLNNTKDVNDLKKILCVYNYAEEILKRTIENVEYLDYSFFHIACSCVTLAREFLNFPKPWNSILIKVHKISYEDFKQAYHFVLKNKNCLYGVTCNEEDMTKGLDVERNQNLRNEKEIRLDINEPHSLILDKNRCYPNLIKSRPVHQTEEDDHLIENVKQKLVIRANGNQVEGKKEEKSEEQLTLNVHSLHSSDVVHSVYKDIKVYRKTSLKSKYEEKI